MGIKKLKASTMAEFVVALSVFAICFMVASYVFIQSNRNTIQYQEVAAQTEFQSQLFKAFKRDSLPVTKLTSNTNMSIQENKNEEISNGVIYTLNNSVKEIWKQDFYLINDKAQ